MNAGDVPTTAFAPTSENLTRVANGTLRLRQRPGPANALGAVKFVFPNRYNVFLHGTPAQELFAQTRRDFSHGCIRIEQPADLAALVLRDQAPWTEAAIDSAMAGDRTVHVPIAHPLSVFVLYTTVAVDDAGQVHFYPDIYRRDRALERALGLTPIARTVIGAWLRAYGCRHRVATSNPIVSTAATPSPKSSMTPKLTAALVPTTAHASGIT